jgi:nitrogen fixation/metabolism regulation signal transduction histidine kinase
LNKITSLENKYLERAAKQIAQQTPDKVAFLLSATVDDINDNILIDKNIIDYSKSSKLAFNIWSKTKFFNEDINSAVIVLDTLKNPVSDFCNNPSELIIDSVLNFTLSNFKNKSDIYSIDENEDALIEELDSIDIASVSHSILLEDENILQNKENKFYSVLIPVERADLKYSQFNKIIGYVIFAASYDSRNFLAQSNFGIFRSFTADNILSKLTSQPVISEFLESELVASTNKDFSKSLLKSIDAFKENVKDKIDKSALRYDDYQSELFKSYYVLNESKDSKTITGSRITVVSVKVNDFSLSTFYFFRYLLFIALIYIVLIAVYTLYKLFLFIKYKRTVTIFKFGFREKLFASFLFSSLIPIIILALYTRALVSDKNEVFYKNQLNNDLNLVEQYIKSVLDENLHPKLKNYPKESKSDYKNIFNRGFLETDKNFNLFIKNNLVATTNEQFYKSDLLDTRISGNAYYYLNLLKKDYFLENQQIGDFNFIVGYKPVFDKFSNLTGIISSQSVFKQSEINQELTESLVYILGPYVAAIILLVFIINFLSYRISNPILKLQKATEQLSKGNINIEVKSNSKDEIGVLVDSFNRMIKELKRSRAELKKAERESAWRDIARQVAHEIKNPLTPMKLAMQHLYYAYKNSSPDFNNILQTTNKLIIDQIEVLNRIATEFSNFAKLPSRNYQFLNMNEIVSDVVKLMNSKNNILLKLDSSTYNKNVYGDKDDLRRALINIVKNSLQAVDEKQNNIGKVTVSAVCINGYYKLNISDNGEGMDDDTLNKLFEPYFSTKSSGMGLGLVITKKILDDMKADITVHSQKSVGTNVEINFKVADFKQE